MLCGCGVMFKLVQAFLESYRDEFKVHLGWEKWLLDLVGISTVSDMVPLVNENRIFAKYGLRVIKKTKRLGLKKLMWDAGISAKHLTEEDIGFGISPKINAASRMSHPEDAVAVLRSKTDLEAQTSVDHIMELNKQRKKLVAQTTKAAYKKLEKRTIGNVIVVGSPDWKAGILGLIASKLVEKYHVPAFVWSEENGEVKGSCRTYNGVHLVELMQSADPKTFLQYGGHAEAAGFSCVKNEIHFMQERLDTACTSIAMNTEKAEPTTTKIDAEITLDDVNYRTYTDISQLAPFGVGNAKPLFIVKNVIPISVDQFGKTKEHLDIRFKNKLGKEVRAIAFFKTPDDYQHIPTTENPFDTIGYVEHSVFMGHQEVRLHIVDILPVKK